MLNVYDQHLETSAAWAVGEPLPSSAVWLDLLDATDAERKAVEKLLDVRLPQRSEISRLGLSSRHQQSGETLFLHARLYADDPSHKASPLGMFATHERLVTLRYAPSRPLRDVVDRVRHDEHPLKGPAIMVSLLGAIVDDVAEQMQDISDDVASLSEDIFKEENESTRLLRRKLLRVGKLETRLARFRTALLAIGRGVDSVEQRASDWLARDTLDAVETLAKDLKVLDEFDDQLTGKLQFLQDAALGFISTDQNSVMKLLTVAPVVTIPPVILAGIWGMNFKHVPELSKA